MTGLGCSIETLLAGMSAAAVSGWAFAAAMFASAAFTTARGRRWGLLPGASSDRHRFASMSFGADPVR
jgi:hypothetical protein